MQQHINNHKLRQIFFLTFLVFMFIMLFRQMSAFVPGFLGAITFYILLRRWMRHLVEVKNWRRGLAASFLLFVSFLVVMVPVGLTVNILSSRVGFAINHSKEIIEAISRFIQQFQERFHIELASGNNVNSISATIANTLKQVLSATFNSVTTVAVMYFILYFMLVKWKELEEWLYRFIPLKNDNVVLVGKEMKMLVISNALGIPLVAILQGVVGLIGYLIIGVDDVWFWFVFTCIASMLPFVGSALAYVPLSIVLFVNNQTFEGFAILIYGFAIIGAVDNIFRFMVQKKIGDIHPLITVFGVIIGINLFGFIGLIFGPILISMFILLVKIYMNEFVEEKKPPSSQLEL